jgi:hypothetical protein
MATQTTALAHQSQHFEALQMSARAFYVLLKDMIESYQYPDVRCEPVTLSDAGLFSPSLALSHFEKRR